VDDRDEDEPESDVDFYLNVHPSIKPARSSSPMAQDDKAQAVLGCDKAYGPPNIEYSPDIPQSSFFGIGVMVPSLPL